MSLLLSVITTGSLEAQCIVTVTDRAGVSLPGAALTSPDLEGGEILVSDASGEIDIPADRFDSGPISATIHYIGMAEKEVEVENGQHLTVAMDRSAITLGEAVVTGEYGPTHVENAVHRVDIIDAEQIAATASTDITQVLRHSSEIILQQDGVLGTGISIQGLSDRHVKITIDEVPMVGRVDGKVDLTQIDVQDIERIEIVRGPMAASYGSDAIAGVINIITKEPSPEQSALAIRGYTSSEGQYDLTGRFSSGAEKYRYAVRGGRRFFDGWSPDDPTFGDIEPIADKRRSRRWNQKEQYLAGLDHGVYGKGRALTHRFSLSMDELKDRGLPVVNNAAETIIALDDTYNTRRIDNQLKYVQDTLWGGRYSGYVAYNHFERDRRQQVTDLTDLSRQTSSQDTTIYKAVTTRHTWAYTLSDKVDDQSGLDASYEESSGQRIEGSPNIFQIAGFYSLEYRPIDGLALRPALRWAYHDLFDVPLIPTFSARYRRGVHTLRASYGRGFRAPDFKELYLAFFDVNHNVYGNPDLDAERSQSIEAGYSLNTTVDHVRWTAGLSAFYNEVEGLITEVQDGAFDGSGVAPFTYHNIDRVQTQGLRLDLGADTEQLDVSIGAGVIGTERTDAGVFLTPMTYSWQANASALRRWNGIGLDINLLYTYNGEQTAVILRGDITESTSREAYQMLDLTVSKRLLDERLRLRTGIRNLLDVTDLAVTGRGGIHGTGSSESSLISTGRTYFLALEYDLTFSKKK